MKQRMQSALQTANGLFVGARIANARGTPGTLGLFALTLDDHKPVLLTSEHVLFGAGGREQEPVWLVDGASTPVARTRHGRRGVVRHASNDIYVDCATAELAMAGAGRSFEPEAAGLPAAAGEAVHKIGAASGTTHGRIAHANYSETVRIGGRAVNTCGQILVRPEDPSRPFNIAGDSGAALRSADGKVIGLVWGTSAQGGALACPIAPVLWVLHVQLARAISPGAD
jgi:hypothetical protein